jgi:hypothetical protein
MGATPDHLKTEIEQTRGHLTGQVDALADKVSPARITKRRLHAVKGGASNVKDKMMGSAVQDAPEQLTRQAQGNPLPAAVIAFGAGGLAATLLPTTDAEHQLVGSLRARGIDPMSTVKDTAAGSGRRLKQSMTEPARGAMGAVKDTASSAASNGGQKASDIHVAHKDGNWVVEQKGTGVISTHGTQALAAQAGRRRARRDRTEFVLHGRDGRIRMKDSYGSDPSGRRG